MNALDLQVYCNFYLQVTGELVEDNEVAAVPKLPEGQELPEDHELLKASELHEVSGGIDEAEEIYYNYYGTMQHLIWSSLLYKLHLGRDILHF